MRNLSPQSLVLGLGTLALAGWIVLAFFVDPVGSLGDIRSLVAVAGFELALAAVATAVVVRAERRLPLCRRPLVAAMAMAALFRLLMVPAGLAPERGVRGLVVDLEGVEAAFDTHLLYDNDVWRYLWDGRIQRSGFDPYRTTPASIEALADAGDAAAESLLEDELWFEIHQRIGYLEHPSVYPMLAQMLLALLAAVAPGSVVVLKLSLIAADFGVCLLLVALLGRLGRPRGLAVLYAWHPLPIKEIAGSAHIDAWAVLLLVAAVLALTQGRARSALIAWGGAIAIKLSPVALAGIFLARTPIRRWWWPLAVLAALAIPFVTGLGAMLESVHSFVGVWRFNAGAWRLFGVAAARFGSSDPAFWADALGRVAVIALAVAAAISVRSGRAEARATRTVDPAADSIHEARRIVLAVFVTLAAIVVLSPAVMPWYGLWALPFAAATGRWPFVIFGGLLFLSYFTYAFQQEKAWWLLAEHGGYFAALGVERLNARLPWRVARE